MADIDEKTPLNVPGKFYVDSSCIDCDLCRETAPENFGRDDDEGVSYVKKQPDNETEQEAWRGSHGRLPRGSYRRRRRIIYSPYYFLTARGC